MSGKLLEIVEAWIKAMEDAQPAYGELLQSTVDAVGPLPVLEEDGSIRTYKNDATFFMSSAFTKGFAAQLLDARRIKLLNSARKLYKEQGDEEAMARAQEKGRFYQSLSSWAEATEPRKAPLREVPRWLAPFVSEKETTGQGAADGVP